MPDEKVKRWTIKGLRLTTKGGYLDGFKERSWVENHLTGPALSESEEVEVIEARSLEQVAAAIEKRAERYNPDDGIAGAHIRGIQDGLSEAVDLIRSLTTPQEGNKETLGGAPVQNPPEPDVEPPGLKSYEEVTIGNACGVEMAGGGTFCWKPKNHTGPHGRSRTK